MSAAGFAREVEGEIKVSMPPGIVKDRCHVGWGSYGVVLAEFV